MTAICARCKGPVRLTRFGPGHEHVQGFRHHAVRLSGSDLEALGERARREMDEELRAETELELRAAFGDR